MKSKISKVLETSAFNNYFAFFIKVITTISFIIIKDRLDKYKNLRVLMITYAKIILQEINCKLVLFLLNNKIIIL